MTEYSKRIIWFEWNVNYIEINPAALYSSQILWFATTRFLHNVSRFLQMNPKGVYKIDHGRLLPNVYLPTKKR
jgi:hypothetical protein